MEPLSSLHLLTEAVRNAGADIAPSYQEYIQLAFAISTDCGEAGRQDFLAQCSLSSKYDHQAAEKLFSNALKNGHNDVHIGTAFHLAELCGVKIEYENPGTVGTVGTEVHRSSGTHTHVRTHAFYIIAHVVISRFLISYIRAFDKFLFHPYSLPARFSAFVSAKLKRWRFLCPSLQPFAGIQSV